MRVVDMDIRTDSSSSKATVEKSHEYSSDIKNQFDPRRSGERHTSADDIGTFLEGLCSVAPTAVIFTGLAYQLGMQKSPPGTLLTVQETADIVSSQFPGDNDAVRELCERLILTKEQVDLLEKQTKEQATSAIWKAQRRGRITGSKCKTVSNKVDELIRNKNAVVTPLVHSLMTEGKDIT